MGRSCGFTAIVCSSDCWMPFSLIASWCHSWFREKHTSVRVIYMTDVRDFFLIWRISSTIIQDIDCMCAAKLALLAYYYFDSRESKKQDLDGLLSSLLYQLSSESDSYRDILVNLYSDCASGTRKPSCSAASGCLTDMLKLPGQSRIYIIVDALDECPASDVSGRLSAREEVLELIKEVVSLKLQNLHLCVASRPEIDVKMVLEPLKPLEISLDDEVGQKNDVSKYIESAVHSYPEMTGRNNEEIKQIIDTLTKDPNGL